MPNRFDILIDKRRLFIIDGRRIAYVLLFIVTFIITEIGRHIYRPYIYSHHIFDYWIADTIGNFTGTMAVIFFEIALINPVYRIGRYLIVFITFGLIIYELVQYVLPGRNTCDWRDIIATIFAGILSLVMFKFVSQERNDKKSPPFNVY